jgi:predicted nucleic acid-binding protein
MSNSVIDFRGDVLYLDTTTFYLFLRAATPEARTLFQNIEQGVFQAYTSVLTFDELAYRMLLALIRDTYKGAALDHLCRNQTQMIEEFYPRVDPHLVLLGSYPNLNILDITHADLDAMRHNIRQFRLRPRDALHLAAMQKVNCFALASQDSDFDIVPEVERYSLRKSQT